MQRKGRRDAASRGPGGGESSRKASGRVLLLQGPVGRFFSALQEQLETEGCVVRRITFSPADRIFSPGRAVSFAGGPGQWEAAFAGLVEDFAPDVVVLFGSTRPAHVVAREICGARGIPVLSLEEGYIRPGFFTAEWGGNNADSPLSGRGPADGYRSPPRKGRDFRGFAPMARHAALHYLVRTLFSSRRERALFHRPVYPLGELSGWIRNIWRRLRLARKQEARAGELIGRHSGRFFLVPLQVPTDANLQGAACGWSSRRLIETAVASFARHAAADCRLVFKIHPLARGHGSTVRDILEAARGNGISDRIDVLETGPLGPLARHCAGMITINSTSGLSAIAHGRPLMVVGRAVYSNSEFAICANGKPDFDRFWAGAPVAPEGRRKAFLSWISDHALLPGDFYARAGQAVAVKAMARKIGEKIRGGDHEGG